MYAPPFHRRILPWIFAVVFLAAAPVVVFYTAGYRWNPKKEKVERNGTLIMNTEPSGATIMMNGQTITDTTPTTLQNVPPGRTVIRFEKNGYYPWQKELDIIPERVTFANTVWLWKISTPTRVLDQPVYRLAASPNVRDFAALVSASPTTGLVIWSSDGSTRSFTLASPASDDQTLSWSSDARSLFVDRHASRNESAWMVSLRANQKPTKLPPGRYRWSGSDIEGVSDAKFLNILSSNGRIQQTPLVAPMVDLMDRYVLRRSTSTNQLVIFTNKNDSRGIILPTGNWTFDRIVSDHLVLRDDDHWISINPDEEQPIVHRASGHLLPPYLTRGQSTFLLVSNGELWTWNPTTDPELLLREGQPITGASWHASGENIAVASNGSAFILNTDPRDGRLRTALASFDEIFDVAVMKKKLYIAGRRGEERGVWELTIE